MYAFVTKRGKGNSITLTQCQIQREKAAETKAPLQKSSLEVNTRENAKETLPTRSHP